MAKLIMNYGTPQAREFELKPGANYLGRGETNDCRITDGSVSTNHAEITVDGSSIHLKDLGSTNGTFINQSAITEAILRPGQSFRLGSIALLLLADVPVAAAVPVGANPFAPPPRPVGAGLKISGLHHAEPDSPPVTELAPAPAAALVGTMEPVEPPPGKAACKFHPKISGQWMCQKCNELFCALCVSNKPSDAGTIHACRKCGAACVPVKVKAIVSKEKTLVAYSDKVLLLRSLGFGFGAALLGALIWIGLSALFGFDVPFLFGPMVGALCGYAVKIACQDTPSPIFSGIAVTYCIIGCIIGKVGMIAVTHLTINTNTTYATGGLGLALAVYAAWKIGGADS